jgi:hypothetical protein
VRNLLDHWILNSFRYFGKCWMFPARWARETNRYPSLSVVRPETFKARERARLDFLPGLGPANVRLSSRLTQAW